MESKNKIITLSALLGIAVLFVIALAGTVMDMDKEIGKFNKMFDAVCESMPTQARKQCESGVKAWKNMSANDVEDMLRAYRK